MKIIFGLYGPELSGQVHLVRITESSWFLILKKEIMPVLIINARLQSKI
jgi:hypothetical protein